ncbi:helix-turn-helix domain-containing protein [Streptosporangium subroseum]|uniref:helix-turn-helix domain-containing protein n=1 Tax=Streptosporangium subroseum TaxID=106412 RepID=UPI00352C7C99
MRYSDRGGMSMRARAERERLRFVAADMFAGGMSAPQVARELSITRKPACAWRQAWEAGGKAAHRTCSAAEGSGFRVSRLGAAAFRSGYGAAVGLHEVPGTVRQLRVR